MDTGSSTFQFVFHTNDHFCNLNLPKLRNWSFTLIRLIQKCVSPGFFII